VAIEVVNRQRLVAVDGRAVGRVAAGVLAEVGRHGAGLTVAFVRDRAMRELNLRFRGKDRPTDVLSFPGGDGDALHLGDVVISTDTASRQAEDAGHSLGREVSELVIHGVLHLCGYDHETDRGQMNRLELKLRRKLLYG
jgi:probable rRNA maturation factor